MDRMPLTDADMDFASARRRTISETRNHLERLTQPGFLGLYTQVVVYEIFALSAKSGTVNVLTVAVLEEGAPCDIQRKKEFLTGKLIQVKGLKGWSFGAIAKRQPLSCLDDALAGLESGLPWALSGDPLALGKMQPLAPIFVPPDGAVLVPINRLLRNNFWNGSHVIRLSNTDTSLFQPFLDDRRMLQDLSEALRPVLPMTLGAMVDYLGDVLIQVPVTAAVIRLRQSPGHGPLWIESTWHPGVTPRPLQASARMDAERAIAGASVTEIFTASTPLSEVRGLNYPVQFEVWDHETGLLIAASAPVSFMTQGTVQRRFVDPEPRVFTILNPSGERSAARIEVQRLMDPIVVGSSPDTPADRGARARGHLEEFHRLSASRAFVQYRPGSGLAPQEQRQKALDDLRILIVQHGDRGVDLWDPYLSAEDVLQTLFYCPVIGAPLRALSDRLEPPAEKGTPTQDAELLAGTPPPEASGETAPCTCTALPQEKKAPAEPFAIVQKRVLDAHAGNRHGLNLEFRARFGPKGWGFHDRFLIFPHSPDGPQAWSLGTSVNHIGKTHHILQRVGNAGLIAAAFNDLWMALDEPFHQVWKSQ
jgi:hypothetical protein